MLNTKIIKQLFGPADSVKYTLPCKPGNTVLVIAPHPDDETLGCGGIIAQMLQNDVTVAVLLVTDGNGGGRMPNIKKIRMHEFECAKTVLGFTKDFRLAFPDGGLVLYEDEFCEKISKILKKKQLPPDFCTVPTGLQQRSSSCQPCIGKKSDTGGLFVCENCDV